MSSRVFFEGVVSVENNENSSTVLEMPEILEEAVERIEDEIVNSNWIKTWQQGGNWEQTWRQS